VERGTQGQGTRDGGLSFENQVAREGKISSDTPFPAQRPATGTIYPTGPASALSSAASVEEAAIDVSRIYCLPVCEREMMRCDRLSPPRSVEFKDSPDGTRVRVAAIDALIETAFLSPPLWHDRSLPSSTYPASRRKT